MSRVPEGSGREWDDWPDAEKTYGGVFIRNRAADRAGNALHGSESAVFPALRILQILIDFQEILPGGAGGPENADAFRGAGHAFHEGDARAVRGGGIVSPLVVQKHLRIAHTVQVTAHHRFPGGGNPRHGAIGSGGEKIRLDIRLGGVELNPADIGTVHVSTQDARGEIDFRRMAGLSVLEIDPTHVGAVGVTPESHAPRWKTKSPA